MSSNLAYASTITRPIPRTATPRHVEIVATRAQRKARPKAVYAIVTVGSLFIIFAAQLLLSIAVSQGAYTISDLQSQQHSLARTQDSLTEKLYILDSTQNLAAQAAHLGMSPNGSPLAINVDTGAVFGLPGSKNYGGCGGSCNLITNSLLGGVPLVNTAPAAVTVQAGDTTANASAVAASVAAPAVIGANDPLPAPVTH